LSRIIAAPSLPSLVEGYASVTTESLIPTALENIQSGKDFVERLPEFDDHFENMRASAQKEGKVLRFVALIDVKTGKVKAGLERCVLHNIIGKLSITMLELDTLSIIHSHRHYQVLTTSSPS